MITNLPFSLVIIVQVFIVLTVSFILYYSHRGPRD
jgi:hypothetical protein